MVCPNCGSTNVHSEQKQVINNNVKVKAGNGCLWWLLLGWLYILYLIFKWIFKAIYFIFIGWWVALIKRNKKSKESRVVVHICQDCGHKWETVAAKTVSNPPSRKVVDNRTPIVVPREAQKEINPAPAAPVYGEARRSAPASAPEPRRSTPVYYDEPRRTAPAAAPEPRRTAPAAAPAAASEPRRTAPAAASEPRRTGMTGSLWNRPAASGFDAAGTAAPTRTVEAPRTEAPVRSVPTAEAEEWVCSNCEATNDASARFCSVCGQPKASAPKAPVNRTTYCMKCGAAVTPGAVFCMKCGARQN